jgi:membrane protein DedA with SNARE-associated domain
VVAVVIAVATIVAVTPEIVVIAGGRWWGVPILKLDDPQADQIAERRHVVLDNLMGSEVRW